MSVEPALFGVVLAALLVAISVIDARQHRIPNALNLGLLLAGCGLQARMNFEGLLLHVVFAAAVALLFLAVRQIHFWSTGVIGLGLGDVKMAGAGAMWFAPALFSLFLFTASFCALGFALVTVVMGSAADRFRRVPFGPFLAAGVAAAFGLENFWP